MELMPDRTFIKEIFKRNIEFGNIAHDFIWTCEEYLNFIRPLFYFNVDKILESIKESLLKKSVFSPQGNFTKSFRNLIPNFSHHSYYFTKHQNEMINDYQKLLEEYVSTLQTYINWFRNIKYPEKSMVKIVFSIRENRQQLIYFLDLTLNTESKFIKLLNKIDTFLTNPYHFRVHSGYVERERAKYFNKKLLSYIAILKYPIYRYQVEKSNSYENVMKNIYLNNPSFVEKIRTFEIPVNLINADYDAETDYDDGLVDLSYRPPLIAEGFIYDKVTNS